MKTKMHIISLLIFLLLLNMAYAQNDKDLAENARAIQLFTKFDKMKPMNSYAQALILASFKITDWNGFVKSKRIVDTIKSDIEGEEEEITLNYSYKVWIKGTEDTVLVNETDVKNVNTALNINATFKSGDARTKFLLCYCLLVQRYCSAAKNPFNLDDFNKPQTDKNWAKWLGWNAQDGKILFCKNGKKSFANYYPKNYMSKDENKDRNTALIIFDNKDESKYAWNGKMEH
jgi:hypothetical protein